MKKLAILFSIIMVAVIVICIYIQDTSSINSVKFTVNADNGVTQNIDLYYYDGKHYAFLPSYTNFNSLNIKYNAASLYIDGKYYNSDSSCSEIVIDKEYSLELKNFLGITVCKSSLIFMKSGDVPALSINLVDGDIDEINNDKEVSKSGYARIINPDKTIDFSGSFKGLHGRGNSTWQQAKKSYTLEFSKDVALLGMGEGKGWVLLSNSFDESGLRNKLAYDAAKEIGVDYAVDSEYVDLYINNNYYGLYLLTERVEVGENRVNINDLSEKTQGVNYMPLSSYTKFEVTENNKIQRGFIIPNNPNDITGGYLLQIEHHDERIEEKESLVQTSNLSFSLSSPKYASKEQVEYIFSYLNDVENDIINNNLTQIDLDSFVKYYLIQELFANCDNCSFYYYKNLNNSQLGACAIWDFDLSIGNSWLVSDMSPKFFYRNKDNWFNYIYDNNQFITLLKRYYLNSISKSYSDRIVNKLYEYRNKINQSFNMDKIRWHYVSNTGTWADKSQNRFENLDDHIYYIIDFMKKRIEFLDSVWVDNEEYYYISFSTSENTNIRKNYSVIKGETFNENPTPDSNEIVDYKFLGWYDSDGNKYVPNRIITKNESYTAKWEKTSSTVDEASLTLLERIKLKLTGEYKYIIVGLGIIISTIVVFVVIDIKRKMKSRRYHNGHKN